MRREYFFLLDLVNQKSLSHIIRTLKKKPIATGTVIST